MKLPSTMPAPFGALKPINKPINRFPKEEVIKAAKQPVTPTVESSEDDPATLERDRDSQVEGQEGNRPALGRRLPRRA